MPTTGKIKAKDIGFYTSQDSGTTWELAALAQSGEITVETSMTDVTTDGDGNYASFLPDLNSATMNVDGLVQYSAITNNILGYELLDLQLAQTAVLLKYTTDVTGDREIQSTAYIQTYSESKSRGEALSYSCNFQLSGTITHQAVPV